MSNFSYLIEKIRDAKFEDQPFKCLIIDNFLSNEHFEKIIRSQEIKLPDALDHAKLIKSMNDYGYKPVKFPGSVTDESKYLEWINEKNPTIHNQNTCEGFGIAYRLQNPQSEFIEELLAFIHGDEFFETIIQKFDLIDTNLKTDFGIQKYLSGYEISPHPDIRRKALTFMLNLNTDPKSHLASYHTHLMEYKPEYQYIPQFWKGNPDVNTCWLPWSWASTFKMHATNNSIIFFRPSHDSLHAVKATYNHLTHQRTQLYGNLWFEGQPPIYSPNWQKLQIVTPLEMEKYFEKSDIKRNIYGRLGYFIPGKAKKWLTKHIPSLREARYK